MHHKTEVSSDLKVTSVLSSDCFRSEGGEHRTEGALGSEEASNMNQQLQILSSFRTEVPASIFEVSSDLIRLRSE